MNQSSESVFDASDTVARYLASLLRDMPMEEEPALASRLAPFVEHLNHATTILFVEKGWLDQDDTDRWVVKYTDGGVDDTFLRDLDSATKALEAEVARELAQPKG